MKNTIGLLTLCLLAACKGDGRRLPDADTDDLDTSEVDGTDVEDGDTDSDTLDVSGPRGFVGGPCQSTADCSYDGGVCLTEAQGFPGGMCSLECDRFCPDAAGHPTTFCVSGNDLVESPFATGSCASWLQEEIPLEEGSFLFVRFLF